MERSATNPAMRPPFPTAARKSHDARVLFIAASIAVGAAVAIYALTVSGPVDPTVFDSMVAFP